MTQPLQAKAGRPASGPTGRRISPRRLASLLRNLGGRRFSYTLRYLGRPVWDTGIAPPELVFYAQHAAPGRALDVGCGTGASSVYLAQHGWAVTGIDFIPLAIWRARRRAKRAHVQVDFLLGAVPAFEGVRRSFDLALDIGCFHGLLEQDKARYPAALAERLRPAGVLLLFAFVPPATPSVSPEEVQTRFAPFFELSDLTIRPRREGAWYRLVRRLEAAPAR